MPGKYPFKRADFEKINTYSISDRKSLVKVEGLADLAKYSKSGEIADLLPGFLKANDLKRVVGAIKTANANGNHVVAGIGAHVIKVGLSPILIDMMQRGILDAIALNGAGIVHDLEIAFHGQTSEDVASEIKSGRFGMVAETQEHFNKAISRCDSDSGLGEAVGKYIVEQSMPSRHLSILGSGYELDKPITVHVALGTDIVHAGQGVNGATIGQASMNDFKMLTSIVGELEDGVYLNIGSSVVLPEVFIKALSSARNLGFNATGFMAVNMDMIQHYRPAVNVVHRPTLGEGKGVTLTGHHEIMIPLLYHMLIGDVT